MFRFVHVDEVDDDDTAHIAQAQLSRNLHGRFQIDSQCILFLRIFFVQPMTAVHVNDVHGLGVFDDEVNTISDCDYPTEQPLDLSRHTIMFKDRLFSFVELHDVALLRGDGGNVAFDFIEKRLVVNSDRIKRLVKQVAEHSRGTVKFAHKFGGSLASV